MPQIRNGVVCVAVLLVGFTVAFFSVQPLPPPSADMHTLPAERAAPEESAPRVSFPAPTSEPAERLLEEGTVHVYPLTVKPGDLVELIVEQDGVDLQVSILDSGGGLLFTVDSPTGQDGPERAALTSEAATSYRAEVCSRGFSASGSYRIWMTRRPASELDRMEAKAERLFHQAREALKSGDFLSSESKLLEAGGLWKKTRNLGRQADALRMMGNLYRVRWEWQRSLEIRQQAKTIYHRARRFGDAGKVANEIGVIHELLSDLKAAGESYEEALALGERSRNPHVAAVALGNLGNLARWQSRLGEALEKLERARLIWRELQDAHEIKVLADIGAVLAEAGKLDLALSRFRESIELADRRRDSERKAGALVQMGHAVRRVDPELARRLYQQALRIQQEQNNLEQVAVTLNGIGLVLLDQKRYQDALAPLERAFRIYSQKNTPLEQARTLTNLGWTYAGLGRERDAQSAYQDALARARGKDGWTEVGAQLGLARLEEQRQNPIAAQNQAEAAVRSVERLRAAVSPELRISFFANRQDVYGALIEILLWQHELNPSAGYDAKALEISEQSRSRGLLDDVTKGAGSAGGEGSFLGSRRILSLTDIQRVVLDPETLLLEFYLGRRASYLWLVSHDSHRVFKLPPREQIERLIEAARLALTMSARREEVSASRRAVSNLSHALLGPAALWLGEKRLLISAPDALQGIPFAVLPDPAVPKLLNSKGWPKPLIIEHEIIKIPSASVLAALQARQDSRASPRDRLAILADPVFESSDERVGRVVATLGDSSESTLPRFKRLTHAREEAEAILVETGRDGVLAAFDFDANRDLALSGRLGTFRNLHFATHGRLQSNDADLSAIVLSQVDSRGRTRDGLLRAADISNLDLRADLVVLSACETGLGEEIRGEGLVGLPQAFMDAGATRLVVSLWRVDDRASSELMQRFYHGYLSRGLSPAAALRDAQKVMWQSRRYGAPFFWGAFELQGDWRPAGSPR